MTPRGWQCPLCSKVYSPTTPMCFTCPQTTKAQSHTGTQTDTPDTARADKPWFWKE